MTAVQTPDAPTLPTVEQIDAKLLELRGRLLQHDHALIWQQQRRLMEQSLACFIQQAWPILEPSTPLVWNWHLDILCAYYQAYLLRVSGLNRLIINVPPGSMKSMIVSVFGPAWAWGPAKQPARRWLNLTNEGTLATRDSLKMRQVVTSDWYQDRWPVTLNPEQNEKTLWGNTSTGYRQCLGFTSNITGKRGTDLLIDDAVDAKRAFSDQIIQEANRTYDQAITTRLDDPDKDGICSIMQRLRPDDLTGHMLSKKEQHWVHLRIPMEYEGVPSYTPPVEVFGEQALERWPVGLADPRRRQGELMFPKRFSERYVRAIKEDLGEYGAAGQLQQSPMPAGGGIIKARWWRRWPKDAGIPPFKGVFSSWDTAFTERDLKDAAFTARTTWGVFEDQETGRDALLLIGRWWKRVGSPDLRAELKRRHKKGPEDYHVIERKASGYSLLQEAKRLRIPCRGFDPKPHGDKVERMHFASPMIQAGLVWVPERDWGNDFINLVAMAPTGAPPCLDVTDTVTQAIIWTRRKMWLSIPDEDDVETDTEDSPPDDREAAYG